MPPTPDKSPDIFKTAAYQSLLSRVRRTLLEGQARIDAERVQTYWQTGEIIYKDILKNKDRGTYGAEITKGLAKDLNVHVSVLQRCVQFVKAYPQLTKVAGRRLLKWSHFRELMAITDDKKRLSLEKAVEKNDWSSDELINRIRLGKSLDSDSQGSKSETLPKPSPKLLTPLRGKLFHYAIVKRPTIGGEGEPELFLDLGFGDFEDLTEAEAGQFSAGDIVALDAPAKGIRFSKVPGTVKDIYTYQAVVEKVVDGDTLKVRFFLGGRHRRRETLRLRGLDCPEMDTREGQAAKVFVQSYIKEAQTIIVRSSRSDKWDRYLADIFLPGMADNNISEASRWEEAGGERARRVEADIYLNNLLLEKGYAKRME